MRCYSLSFMFSEATAFDQDITKWTASGSSNNMFFRATRWQAKYERTAVSNPGFEGSNRPAGAWSLKMPNVVG